MNGEIIVYAKPPDGQLEVFGSGMARGIWPEAPSWTHSETGAEQMTLTLHRRADVQWSDLIAGTPVWVMRDGMVGFQGRIRQTPSARALAGDTITVQLEGLTANLVDDTLRLNAVTCDLNAWVDYRSTAYADVTGDKAMVDVQIGNGIIRMQCPKGTTTVTALTGRAGIFYDAGPGQAFEEVQWTFSCSSLSATATFKLTMYAAQVGGAYTNIGDLRTSGAGAVTDSASGVTLAPTRYRYCLFLLEPTSSATTSADVWVTFSRLAAYDNDAERTAAGGFGMRASWIVGKALDKCPLVNTSRTRIASTSFAIPHFVGGQQSPLAYIQAANDYHLWQFFLRDGAAGEPPIAVYRAVPTVPTVIARVGQGIAWEDASRGDASDVYNRVVVQYTDGLGVAQEVTRSAGGLTGAFFTQQSSAALVNGTFENNDTSDWTEVFGTIAAASASPPPGSSFYANCTVDGAGKLEVADDIPPGEIVEGRTYQVITLVKTAVNDSKTFSLRLLQDDQNGVETIASGTFTYTQAFGAWTPLSFTFVGGRDLSLVKFEVYTNDATQAARVISVDQILLFEARPTLWDRQGVIRTKVLATSARMTADAAAQIGDAFLTAHQRTPLKGTLTVDGASLRTWPGEAPVPACIVGSRYVQDAVMIVDTDPDTSDTIRVGIIASPVYDAAADQVKIAVDQRRDFLDALQARLSVEQG